MDHWLIELTLKSMKNLRIPGKHIYDTKKGEIDLKEYNKILIEMFEIRLSLMQKRGVKFSTEQQDEYYNFHKD